MEINNPQSFDHIIGINGEILQPKVLAYADVEVDKIAQDPIIWRKTTADEFHVPSMIVDASARKVKPYIETYESFVSASKHSLPASLLNAVTTDRHLPGGIIGANANALLVKVIEIGPWNMDTTATKNITHGVGYENIVSFQALIRADNIPIPTTTRYPINWCEPTLSPAGSIQVIGPDVVLTRYTDMFFDDAAFDDVDASRGRIIIWYCD